MVRKWYRLLVAAGLLLAADPARAGVEPLWLSLAPAAAKGVDCCPVPEGAKAAATGTSVAGKPERFESEHRPLPVRTYFLQGPLAGAEFTALVRKADGTTMTVDPQPKDDQVKLSFPAAMGDGPMHGPNNLYAVERHVASETLIVRIAKWCTLHHNCGWGHDHKFDRKRLAPGSSDQVPLEIVAHDLWDFNFHSHLMSGDQLNLEVLFRGQPAAGAMVRVTSDKGWSRELATDGEGRARVQLIRDAYPVSWSLFDRNEKGEVRIEARYALEETGSLDGRDYKRIELVTTFPWRYQPARREYTSLAYGLLVALVTMTVSGFGVYIHRQRRRRPRREIVFDEQ